MILEAMNSSAQRRRADGVSFSPHLKPKAGEDLSRALIWLDETHHTVESNLLYFYSFKLESHPETLLQTHIQNSHMSSHPMAQLDT